MVGGVHPKVQPVIPWYTVYERAVVFQVNFFLAKRFPLHGQVVSGAYCSKNINTAYYTLYAQTQKAGLSAKNIQANKSNLSREVWGGSIVLYTKSVSKAFPFPKPHYNLSPPLPLHNLLHPFSLHKNLTGKTQIQKKTATQKKNF